METDAEAASKILFIFCFLMTFKSYFGKPSIDENESLTQSLRRDLLYLNEFILNLCSWSRWQTAKRVEGRMRNTIKLQSKLIHEQLT